ncbi:Uncharacterized protein OBRU01_27326, partial [Operophtera brumata]
MRGDGGAAVQFQPTQAVAVTFASTNLPEHVYLDSWRHEVNVYIPPVKQCLNCMRVEQLQATDVSLETDVSSLKSQLSASEQRSRLNNVEIKGVPLKKDENLFSIVEVICKATNYSFPKTQINYLHTVPLHGSKEKAIVVSFINRYVKEEFVASARACK